MSYLIGLEYWAAPGRRLVLVVLDVYQGIWFDYVILVALKSAPER